MSATRVLLLLALQPLAVSVAAEDEAVSVALEEEEACDVALELRQLRHARVMAPSPLAAGAGSIPSIGAPEPPANQSVHAATQQWQGPTGLPEESPANFQWGPNPGYCLSADGNRVGNGVKVHLWDCAADFDSGGQVWRYPRFEVRYGGQVNYGGQDLIRVYWDQEYCLVVDGNSYHNGAKIQLWRCDVHNLDQMWTFTPSAGSGSAGILQPANQVSNFVSYCLVVDGNQAFNGAKIQLWECGQDLAPKTWSLFAPHS